MNKNELIEDFLKNFKPKQDQSWKSCYFFTHYLKKNHKIDAELIEGMSRINKIDYWTSSNRRSDNRFSEKRGRKYKTDKNGLLTYNFTYRQYKEIKC